MSDDLFDELFNFSEPPEKLIKREEEILYNFKLSRTKEEEPSILISDDENVIEINDDGPQIHKIPSKIFKKSNIFDKINNNLQNLTKNLETSPLKTSVKETKIKSEMGFIYVLLRGTLAKFDIKRDVPLLELVNIISNNEKISINCIKLTHDDVFIDCKESLDSLKIPNFSVLECIVIEPNSVLLKEFNKDPNEITAKEEEAEEGMFVKFQGVSKKPKSYKIEPDEKISSAVNKCAFDVGFDPKTYKYIFDGEEIDISLTPNDLYLDCTFCVDLIPINN